MGILESKESSKKDESIRISAGSPQTSDKESASSARNGEGDDSTEGLSSGGKLPVTGGSGHPPPEIHKTLRKPQGKVKPFIKPINGGRPRPNS